MGSSARARVADTVSRWLDWTEANRTIWLATSAHGENITDADVADLLGRAVALLTIFHPDLAADSPRLRHALECWTALNRAATRRWLRGEATRDATHELLASTLEHVLRTFGAPPRHAARRDRFLSPETVEFQGQRLTRPSPRRSRQNDEPMPVPWLTAVPLPRSGRQHSGRSTGLGSRSTAS